ncbi:hypothetical protein MMC25_006404 [Agyrium rufum]|nr:hypothetical protein [Agyrium rufum]
MQMSLGRRASELVLSALALSSFLGNVVVAAPTATTPSACAQVSSLVEIQLSANSGDPNALPAIPAEDAYNCLISVPLHEKNAEKLLETILPYIRWQTTTAYLVDPPKGYLEPPFDIYATLATITKNLKSGVYKNEYDFCFALYQLFIGAKDGHFGYIPDMVGKVFNFYRDVALVSASVDGKSLPQIYVFDDVNDYFNKSMDVTVPKPVAVIKINGEDAFPFLDTLKQQGNLNDPDALYNQLFWNPAQIALGSQGTGQGSFQGGGSGRRYYRGPSTTLTFANGKTKTYPNYATVLMPLTGVTDGNSFYQTFCQGEEPYTVGGGKTESSSPSKDAAEAAAPDLSYATPGYPVPVIRQSDNLIAGYYLKGKGYDNVAVLSVPSFVGSGGVDTLLEFQNVTQAFLADAKAAGKTKLIIDLSANGGGTIFLGYDLFKQLFPEPSYVPFGETRFRAHEAFNIIGEQYSALAAAYPANSSIDEIEIAGNNPFNYREDLNALMKEYKSWPAVYGPHEFAGDNFTSIIRYNLSDPLQTSNPYSGDGFTITGYLNRSTGFTQPFAKEDIIMLYDGYCASTCTIFSEFMRTQAGIESIAFGGRPVAGDIQAIGGVKGANDYPWDYIYSLETYVYSSGTVAQQAYWNTTDIGQISDYPLVRAYNPSAPAVNARDQILPGDADQVPAQFIYEAADCRAYYTPAMIVDVTQLWKTVADTKWGGKKANCVAGKGLS